jgi:hypothetical protein
MLTACCVPTSIGSGAVSIQAEIKTLSFSVSSVSSFRALVRFCFPFLNDFTIEVPRREPVD